MGRRRWRFITIVAFLLFIKGSRCQGDSDFYYTPHVERSFAQVQPPIFPDGRPTSFYEHGESMRLPARSNQPSRNEGQVRFPSPNYNQNPSPFQVPTGRSQSGGQYYVNQPDYNGAQRQRFRPALPHNYQFVYSTKKPDLPQQIHSAAYQNDPSKPETFLGQITLNNPDIDYLQNTRFKNSPFDNNSLKSNGQSGHISHDDYIENDSQDIFDHRVTTYSPNKIFNKLIVSPKPNGSRFSHFEPPSINRNTNHTNSHKTLIPSHHGNTPIIATNTFGSSTEYKALLELEPLLEDDISDISTFRELMKNNRGSYDVEVIKFNNSTSEVVDDSKPDESIMNAGNAPKEPPLRTSKPEVTTKNYSITTIKENKPDNIDNVDHHEYTHSEEDSDSDNYESYYDDNESTDVNQTSTEIDRVTTVPQKTEYSTDIYDEYDSTEEPEKSHEVENVTQIFDVLAMKHNRTMVKDDNFKHFVDTTVIDQIELPINDSSDENSEPFDRKEIPSEFVSDDTSSILGEEIVSVVTTKSVVNGTISIPQVTRYPATEKISTITAPTSNFQSNDSSVPITTESWVVVASVQTSRSVSGARFLPFPTVEQEEKKQVLTDEIDEKLEDISLLNQHKSDLSNNSSSLLTEDINDKLDSIQSELSSAVLSGALDKDNRNIELISETSTEPMTTTTQSLNVFTLKSTQPSVITERSSPEPLPVMIKKFTPRLTLSTTPKPKRKPNLVTVMDDLAGLLPPGYKPRLTFKEKRTSTTSTTTTSTTTNSPITFNRNDNSVNSTQGRSSGINAKNKVILLDDKSLLPKEYKPKENKSLDDIFKTIHTDNITGFLPPGFKTGDQEELTNDERKSETTKNLSSDQTISTMHETGSKYFKKSNISKILTDDLNKFLPPGYKPSVTEGPEQKIAVKDDISKFLPPGYKQPAPTESENIDLKKISNIKLIKEDISHLLPPGYKPSTSEESETKENKKPDISSFIKDDINKFLPQGYKPPFSETHEKKTKSNSRTEKPNSESKLPANIANVDITALLPPGFKHNDTEKNVEIPITLKVADVSDLLPPGFKINETETSSEVSSTTKGSGGIKLVFPSRPGGKLTRKTTPKPSDLGPALVTPKILKGFPTRASTEFTGWPSPSTTPFSIEKLLEAQRNATATSPLSIDWSTEATTRRTTTTTTTTTPPPTTTPGICRKECEIAATIKIVEGVDWIPELQDPHTEEWQTLAKEVKDELNSVYSKSDLNKWYKNIHIDGFSKGSVIVDYFIELSEVEQQIDTLELKQLFHKLLKESKAQSVSEPIKTPQSEGLNPDVMLGDQPDEERMKKSNEHMTKNLDKTAMKLEIGKFVMDPAYTEFIVVHKREEPKVVEEPEEESFLPQWGIAVIVIAMASLLFVVIFGVTVLVNRQKNFKAKQPIPLSEDMLRELDKSHMGGYDDTHQMKERELPYLPSGKRMSSAFIEQLAYPNPGDSWRSEWTPQLQKYMQHYGADSGRGSQTYGHAGNAYGYSGSQLYGHTGGGSQVYGYTAEYPRSHHSRRRSEYDSNF